MEDIDHPPYLDIRRNNMERNIRRVKLFVNANGESLRLKSKVEECFKKYHFEIVEDDYDLAVAIGGDGAFLRMMHQTDFNSKIYYVGINSGTLGFLQEIKPDEVELFVARLNNNDFKLEEVSIQETTITTKKESDIFYSLNDIVIRDKDLNTAHFSLYVDNNLLENFVGDGILVSTSIGSTAYNLSFGGSIVYGTLHTLQITPIAPLNSKVYRTLQNSVIIPEDKEIKMIPTSNTNFVISIDGENKIYKNVLEIKTRIGSKKIFCLRMNEYNYSDIIYEKFLK